MHKVVITDFIADELAPERKALAGLAAVEAFDAYHEDEFAERIDDAAAIMMYHTIQLTRRTIERLKNCRLIVRCGVGFDNVDHALARERGIVVANVPVAISRSGPAAPSRGPRPRVGRRPRSRREAPGEAPSKAASDLSCEPPIGPADRCAPSREARPGDLPVRWTRFVRGPAAGRGS
jgi:hypothetical protein